MLSHGLRSSPGGNDLPRLCRTPSIKKRPLWEYLVPDYSAFHCLAYESPLPVLLSPLYKGEGDVVDTAKAPISIDVTIEALAGAPPNHGNTVNLAVRMFLEDFR
jgi:hypothetical protein